MRARGPAAWLFPTLLGPIAITLLACDGRGAQEDLLSKIELCLYDNGVPDACIDAYVNGLGHEFFQRAIKEIDGSADAIAAEAKSICSVFLDKVAGATKHSSSSVPAKAPSKEWTDFCFKYGSLVASSFDPEASSAAVTTSTAEVVDEVFPCGQADRRNVLCASPVYPVGDTLTMSMVMTGPIPVADPMYHHQYGFVFDSDADPNNNYKASPQYPNDFFDSTDRWYVATYTPQAGWEIEVSNASGSTSTPVSSDARIVIDGHTLSLYVPANELAVSCAPYRMTAFTHLGDYGQDPPHEWSGDVEPAVGEPLETTCAQLAPETP